jgi:DNA-binding transcriptional regulator LsrR (DeoR family)
MPNMDEHQETIARIKDVRAQAIEHTRQARRLALERRDLMQGLLDADWSQSDIARELDVSRQAIQKMMTMVPAS